LLPGLTTVSIRLIEFATSPAGTQCPEAWGWVQGGFFEESVSDASTIPVLWAKHINLKSQNPQESSLEHLASYQGFIKLSQVDPSSVLMKIACPWTTYAKNFSFSLPLLLHRFHLSLAPWLASLQILILK
jgi:hypothetical protein